MFFYKKPRFSGGESVLITSKASRNRGKTGTIAGYCHGRYTDICRVLLANGKKVNLFDESVELIPGR